MTTESKWDVRWWYNLYRNKEIDGIQFYCLYIHISTTLMIERNEKKETFHATNLLLRPQIHENWAQFMDHSYSRIDCNNVVNCCVLLCHTGPTQSHIVRCAMQQFLSKMDTSHSFAETLLKNRELNIVSAGGGSGRELIGCCIALLEQSGLLRRLNLTAINHHEGWAEIFDRMFSLVGTADIRVSEMFSKVEIDSLFVKTNLLSDERDDIQRAAKAINGGDLILMINILSSLTRESQEKFLQTTFTSMKEDAFFFFVDKEMDYVIDESAKYHMALVSKFQLAPDPKNPDTPIFYPCKVCVLQKYGNISLVESEKSAESDAVDTIISQLHI